ncbi:MAG: aldo/keto reductase [Magnetospiraceae bacterium]
MLERQVGQSDLRVSLFGLGTWKPPQYATTDQLVGFALDHGITYFDTADVYDEGQAERALGAALAGRPRESFIVSTKCFFPTGPGADERGLSRHHITASVDRSLSRLGIGVIDLMLCHRFDPDTPLVETVRCLGDLVRAGKIRHWGVSRWTAAQQAEACRIAREGGDPPPICTQYFYHLLKPEAEREIFPSCGAEGMSVIAYSALAQGVLTGKYRHGIPPGTRAATADRAEMWELREGVDPRVERLAAIADDAGWPLARLALAWSVRHPLVAATLIGASSVDQLRENIAAAMPLPPDLVRALDAFVLETAP